MKFLRNKRSSWRATTLVGALAAGLILAACGDGIDEPEAPADPDPAPAEEAPGEEADDAAAGNVGEGQTISIGWMPWEEAIAVTNLWHVILEANGYEVDQQQLDPGIVFSGIASGDLDIFLDAWLPITHEQYIDQFGADIEDLGPWLADAPLTWAVPTYVDGVDSLADLADNADLFDGTIVGIEPGAGLTRISLEEVIPAYGLGDSFELIESSTPAMLAELDAAYANEEPIVVTLWRPHPAYGRYDLKDLEDPENALGDADQIHAVARTGFTADHPEVAAALENFFFEHDVFAPLNTAIDDAPDGGKLDAARTWVEANRDIVEGWLEGTGLGL
ncbi:MAG: glycine betaine ABC transporter substrate-binding protein [Nitriliruptoraceae bacterium]